MSDLVRFASVQIPREQIFGNSDCSSCAKSCMMTQADHSLVSSHLIISRDDRVFFMLTWHALG